MPRKKYLCVCAEAMSLLKWSFTHLWRFGFYFKYPNVTPADSNSFLGNKYLSNYPEHIKRMYPPAMIAHISEKKDGPNSQIMCLCEASYVSKLNR